MFENCAPGKSSQNCALMIDWVNAMCKKESIDCPHLDISYGDDCVMALFNTNNAVDCIKIESITFRGTPGIHTAAYFDKWLSSTKYLTKLEIRSVDYAACDYIGAILNGM